MKKKLKLLKAWTFEEVTYEAGKVLEFEDEALAKSLMEDGTAELVPAEPEPEPEAESDPGKKVAPTEDAVLQMTEKQLENLLDRVMKRNPATAPKRPMISVVKDNIVDDKKCGYANRGEFFRDVIDEGLGKLDAPRHKKLALSNKVATDQFIKTAGSDELTTLEGSLGDFLIPPEFRADILTEQQFVDTIRPLCQHIPVVGKSISIPSQVDKDHSTGFVHGNVKVYRTIERKQFTSAKPEFEMVELKPKRLTGLCYLTEDLIMHVASLQALIGSYFADAITFYEFGNWLNGVGGADPLGVLNADATVTVSAETGQAADEILPENVRKMRARCFGYDQAVWHANFDVYPALSAMNQKIGTAGALVWQESLLPDRPAMLLGRPLFWTEQCETIGAKGDLVLNSWPRYLLGERAETKVDSSIHVRFEYHEMALRFIKWNDGQPWWRSALTPRKGANTLSPFINLATR